MEEYQNENIQPQVTQPEPELIPQTQEPVIQPQPVQEPVFRAEPQPAPEIPVQPVQPQPARPVSPFAGSPYVEYYPPQQPVQKPKKVKKPVAEEQPVVESQVIKLDEDFGETEEKPVPAVETEQDVNDILNDILDDLG